MKDYEEYKKSQLKEKVILNVEKKYISPLKNFMKDYNPNLSNQNKKLTLNNHVETTIDKGK